MGAAMDSKIIRLIAVGATNKVIAAELGVCEQTVKWHVSRLLRRYQVPNRAALAIEASRGNDNRIPARKRTELGST
jgi:DNA-binding NarL/FixJ family response regulator